MKKFFVSTIVATLCCGLLFAEKIVVGATPVPHAEILNAAKPLLKAKGFDLDVKIFNDYVIPNKATQDGQLDANFFQHTPYLEEFNARENTNIVKTVNVHLEPMGVYSKKIKNLSEIKEGDTIAVPNDPSNEDRALNIIEKAGLVKFSNKTLKTPKDVVENPKNLKFIEIEAAQLPRTLGDATISVINTNFAINAGLNPLKDALFIEGNDSPYVNIVAVKSGNENSPKIKALDEVLNSQEIKKFIENKYQGAIIPAF